MTRRLLWSLLLALILPLAHVAAAAHEVSHVASAAGDKQVMPTPHCDLCAAAAAVTGGAAAATAAVVLHAPQRPLMPGWQPSIAITAEAVAFFLSRAPPSLR